jgi:hypothetical protein
MLAAYGSLPYTGGAITAGTAALPAAASRNPDPSRPSPIRQGPDPSRSAPTKD